MNPISTILFLLTTSSLLYAQSEGGDYALIFERRGISERITFGTSVASAGDVNQDGFDDFIVGSPGFLSTSPYAGSAFVYSGVDGTLLYQWNGTANNDAFGISVAGLGDINGDGFDDLAVGATEAGDPFGASGFGYVHVYSGANGSLLYNWAGSAWGDNFGSSVSAAGDVNGDGMNDVLVGASHADPNGLANAGTAYVYSGANGTVLYQWSGQTLADHFGLAVAGAGDVNGDGFADLVVGARDANPGARDYAGSVYVYSGASGSMLYQWNGISAWDWFGQSVGGAGDINADGFDDIIVGAIGTDSPGKTDAGSVLVYSGANGALLYEWNGDRQADKLGVSVSGAGDVNGDGFADVLFGANMTDEGGMQKSGSAYLRSGASGSLLHQWNGNHAFDEFGYSVSHAGDVNGDGFLDFIVGAKFTDPQGLFNAGTAYIFGFHPLLQTNASSISAASGGILALDLDFSTAAAFHDYITLMSVTGTGNIQFGVSIPLAMDSFVLNSAAGSYPFAISSGLQGNLDASGNAVASISFPAGTFNFAIGRTFWLAAVAFPTGQLPEYSSVAVAVEITP